MKRYPDEIIILKPADGGTPYKAAPFLQVYRGRCRCFLDRQAAFRTNRVMDCTYQVVIPDRFMEDIGENFKVGVKLHTSKSNHNWDLVGYVKDFARHDRVCNLYFQMVKENLIYEDIPPKGYDLTERRIVTYENEFAGVESEGLLINGDQLVAKKPVFVRFNKHENRWLITSNLPISDEEPEPEDEIIYEKVVGSMYGTAQATNLAYFATCYKDDGEDDIVMVVPRYDDYGDEVKPTITLIEQKATWNQEKLDYDYETVYEKKFVIVS